MSFLFHFSDNYSNATFQDSNLPWIFKWYSLPPAADKSECWQHEHCRPGIFMSFTFIERYLPEVDSQSTVTSPAIYRAIVCIIALCYLLFGVSIITHRIVACAEVIAAHKVVITRKSFTGKLVASKQRVWPHAVAFLTFHVVGTCSPEILLTLIQAFRHNFHVDQLGSTLIIGSSAYHIFIITAVCLFTTKESSGKPIRDLYLFFTTGAFALLGTIWVYLVLDHISPNTVELWEAIITLALFPLLVLSAWAMESRWPHQLIDAFRNMLRRGSISPESGTSSITVFSNDDEDDINERRRRRRAATQLKNLMKQHPEKTQTEIEAIVMSEISDDIPKTNAYYRLKATKLFSVMQDQSLSGILRQRAHNICAEMSTQKVGFQSPTASCIESCCTTTIPVERSGAGIKETMLTVHYQTIPGTAKPERNYQSITNGLLAFEASQTKAEVMVRILDDRIYEDRAKFFKVRLYDAAIEPSTSSLPPSPMPMGKQRDSNKIKVEFPRAEVTVSILDDDHCGIFAFEHQNQVISDDVGTARIKVVRSIGSKCKISVPYRIMPGSARLNSDYIVPNVESQLQFEEGQTERFIDLEIVDQDRFGKVFNFYIQLFPPRKYRGSLLPAIANLGPPRLGEPSLVQVGICENDEMKQALDRLFKTADVPTYFVTTLWREQLRGVFIVNIRDDEDDISRLQHLFRVATAYFLHVIAFPWKLCVALLPPAQFLHGYVGYFSLLCLMAVVASLIGDCASLFACTVGLKETVTALTLVPFGMGLPDTFASWYAATNEKTADAAIGGIMGANAVSVFFGIGLSWTICAIVATVKGEVVNMPAKQFGFSMMIFCAFAALVMAVLLLRRLPPIRGELGGPNAIKYLSASFFILLWLFFVALCILESYCIIPDFLQ